MTTVKMFMMYPLCIRLFFAPRLTGIHCAKNLKIKKKKTTRSFVQNDEKVVAKNFASSLKKARLHNNLQKYSKRNIKIAHFDSGTP